MNNILCSIATRGRYFTTLPLVLNAVINQTLKPDKIVIFDDNDEPQDMRQSFMYQHLFEMMNFHGIQWEFLFAEKKGQHHIHQIANKMGYEWVWRVDDDAVPELNVLQDLYRWTRLKNIGAIGGSILTAPFLPDTSKSTGKIENIDDEPNIQWNVITDTKEVDHLHCSFLYRAGVYDYNLGLSRVAHREETLFTYGLKCKGYRILTVPDAITWHMKNPQGGIRSDSKDDMFVHDEFIFRNWVANADKTIVVLEGGMGDHVVFSKVLPDVKNPLVFTCYPEIVQGQSIAEAYRLFGALDQFNVYKKMAQWHWKSSLEDAYRKMYT